MKAFKIPSFAPALLAVVLTGAAWAAGPGAGSTGGPGMGMGAGMPAAAASGAGMGGGMRAQQRMRVNAKNTPGWGLMTQAERLAHRQRLQGMASLDECKAYVAQHHEQMQARAKERGQAMPAQPRRDPCQGLK